MKAPEHDFDAAAASVAALVVSDGVALALDAGFDALGLQSAPEPIGVIATIATQRLCLWKIVQRRGCTGIVADLSRSREEAERSSVRICDRVQLGIHAAFRAANKAPEIPFLIRRLDAVRRAFR